MQIDDFRLKEVWRDRERDDSGFTLLEFVIASAILLVICASVFNVLADTLRSASYQTEVQSVVEHTRLALETVERILCQAGNDPNGTGLIGLTIVSPSEVRVRSDLTGSAGSDKGDPDGDSSDSGEDLTLRYNGASRSLELVPHPGSAQSVANNITAFSLQFYDAADTVTTTAGDVRRVRIAITGATAVANPQTREVFSFEQASDVHLAARLGGR